jgi:hypothetical protein
MNLDRRQNLRKEPEKFAFIQLDRDDGGAVLNVSEGGLSFSTFAPVDQKGPIHFWFSLNLNERIDAWGEVAWTDGTKKVGGMRFIRLPERAGRQIREWISGRTPRKVPEEGFTVLSGAGRPSKIAERRPDAVARFVSKARSQEAPILSSSEEPAGPNAAVPVVGEKEATGELVPMQRYRLEKRRQFIRGLLAGICISAVIAVPVMKYWSYRHENRALGKAPSELSAQKDQRDDSSPGPLKASSETSNLANSSGSGNPKRDAPASRRPSTLASETGGHSGPNASQSPAINPSLAAPLAPSQNGNPGRQKPAMTPQQLWASVQAGNAKAAVALAELYLKGEGVPQNCDQARVLLLMASEKRNAEAIKRLHDLDQTGCPQN